jgi:hypothetical protein
MKEKICLTILLALSLSFSGPLRTSISAASGNKVSWIHGDNPPSAFEIYPDPPTTADLIHFRVPFRQGDVYDNSCLAEQALGGTPTITLGPFPPWRGQIAIKFASPAPQSCPPEFDPVCGLEGSFGPLDEAGEWALSVYYTGRTSFKTFQVSPFVIYYVDKAHGSDVNGGTSWADAYNYLRYALADAKARGLQAAEIRVAQGIYKPNEGIVGVQDEREITFELISGVAVKGGYAGFGGRDPNARDIEAYETILSGDLDGNDVGEPNDPSRDDNSYHVVTGSGTDSTAILDGFTITAGNVPDDPAGGKGAGMLNFAGSPTVTNCTFKDNSAWYGGGMCNWSSLPTITNCKFNGNLSKYSGGGMYNKSSSPTLANCIFNGNSASANGGGMSNWWESSPTLINCTFSRNSANDGGGMYNYADCSPTLTNCILWGNTPDEVYIDSGSPVITYSNVQGGWGGLGNIDADPCFAGAANGDFHLKSEAGRWDPAGGSWIQDSVTSACIDAGDMTNPIGLEPFPNGGRINMGAFGGTAKAGKSYFGRPVCETIVAGDINGDCVVDMMDLAILGWNWLREN